MLSRSHVSSCYVRRLSPIVDITVLWTTLMYCPLMRFLGALAMLAMGCGAVTGIERTAPAPRLQRAPDFKLDNGAGSVTSLSALLATGDVALIFFRGHW